MAGDRRTPTLWSSQTGSRVFSLPQESGPIWSLALSPDGERLAVGQADGGLVIWSVPKIQAQLARIGLAWRPDARPQPQQEPQPFVPETPQERTHQMTQYTEPGISLGVGGPASRGGGAALRRTPATAQKLVDGNPAASDFRNNVGNAHNVLGLVLSRTGKPAEAEAEFRKALPIIQKLADDNPTAPFLRDNLSTVLHNLAVAVRLLGRSAEARDCYDRAIVLIERLVRESPTSTMFRSHLARASAAAVCPQRPGRRPRGSG